jgi:hypothetical protein
MCRHYIAVEQKILNRLIMKDRVVADVSYSPPSLIKFITHFVTAVFYQEHENHVVSLLLTRNHTLKYFRSFQIKNKALSIKWNIFLKVNSAWNFVKLI